MRKTDYPIDPLLEKRWSARAMSGEEISDNELIPLFEAARWAPSSYNGQPWRFLYAKKNSPEWDIFFNLLVEFNQSWCKDASVLVVMISRLNFEHNNKPSRTHSFDTGSAWMSLSLEGASRDLVIHGMEGFDFEKARKSLNIPDAYNVEAMCAIGKPGEVERLPEGIRNDETIRPRKSVAEIARPGRFSFS